MIICAVCMNQRRSQLNTRPTDHLSGRPRRRGHPAVSTCRSVGQSIGWLASWLAGGLLLFLWVGWLVGCLVCLLFVRWPYLCYTWKMQRWLRMILKMHFKVLLSCPPGVFVGLLLAPPGPPGLPWDPLGTPRGPLEVPGVTFEICGGSFWESWGSL